MADHQELFHYTKRAGLEGMLTTNTIWATYVGDLEDRQEVVLLGPELISAVGDRLADEQTRLNPSNRRLWEKLELVQKFPKIFVDSLYEASFSANFLHKKADAFVTSFSTHVLDCPSAREHGIASQWHNYAGPGGFCIVFDTRGLCAHLAKEQKQRHWVTLKISPVRYYNQPMPRMFPELIAVAVETLQKWLQHQQITDVGVRDFLEGATLFKGARFVEEREVRIAGITGSKAAFDAASPAYRAQTADRTYPELHRGPPRHITLFANLNLRLPINRVIVGPSSDQDEAAAFVRALRDDVPIVYSRCPLEPPVAPL